MPTKMRSENSPHDPRLRAQEGEMTNYRECPCCGVKRLLYMRQQRRYTCFHCFKTMKKVRVKTLSVKAVEP